MSLFCATGSADTDLTPEQLKALLAEGLAKLGPRNKVLAVPPDQSRAHSHAGELTSYAWEYFGDRLKAVLPALGTHTAMRPDQIARMFPHVPLIAFVFIAGVPILRRSARCPQSLFTNSRKAS